MASLLRAFQSSTSAVVQDKSFTKPHISRSNQFFDLYACGWFLLKLGLRLVLGLQLGYHTRLRSAMSHWKYNWSRNLKYSRSPTNCCVAYVRYTLQTNVTLKNGIAKVQWLGSLGARVQTSRHPAQHRFVKVSTLPRLPRPNTHIQTSFKTLSFGLEISHRSVCWKTL